LGSGDVQKPSAMDESRINFQSGELQLEGLLALPSSELAGAAVVCHPHPMYGGSMHNNVVEALLGAFWGRRYATLRFNFRGVGESEGEYDGGEGEMEDARAAAAFLSARTSLGRLTLSGYSFGAAIAVQAGMADAAIDRIVAVALPVGVMNLNAARGGKPLLLFSGDRDSYSPVAALRAFADDAGNSARVEVIPGADHFFGGYESRLTASISAALANQ